MKTLKTAKTGDTLKLNGRTYSISVVEEGTVEAKGPNGGTVVVFESCGDYIAVAGSRGRNRPVKVQTLEVC